MEVARQIIFRYNDISQFTDHRRFNEINYEFLERANLRSADPVDVKF